MERKHMSALSIYQSLSGGTKPQVQANAPPAKKIKKKENGIQPNKKSNKKKRTRPLKSSMKLSSSDEEKSKAVSDCETRNGEGFDSPALDVLLTDLVEVNNSRERANRLFQWIIHPVQDKSFFRENWEKKPILIQRQNPDYYKGLFSTAEFDRILRNNDVQYGVNLDVTSYTNGKRETHNPPGRALPYTVWDFYESGCSLRMLNPQAFSSTVWQVLSILQEKFGSMAGANVYLTPARTQGFAPHYDDIEAFILQLEGKKHWRVYNPRSEDEVLPLVSSPNFSQDEIGQPIMDVVLEAGDLLYFPRGFIHQGDCLPDAHSMHITVSSYQRNSWGDLLLKLMPAALEIAMEEDIEFRKGLPNTSTQGQLRLKCICVCFVEENASSVYGAPARWGDGEALDVTVQLKGQTQIRLLGAGAARLCGDGDTVSLFYTSENSRVYHKEEPKSIEMKAEHIDAMEFLIHSYPKFVSVASLPCETMEAKMSLAGLLFEKGLIHTAEPLTAE
uniref:Bifunctional lysine-specific demethylase and histidyl-hydroxylase n=1 Tax=Cyprinus carpio TaxID=7962 RepID=A0A8C2HR70_CYPCA